LSRNILLLS